MKIFMKYLLMLLLLFVINCTHNWGSFKEYSLEPPVNLEVVGTQTVIGKDCQIALFGNAWFKRSLVQATRNALNLAPGATGLRDVSVTASTPESLIFGCMIVEGTPVREKTAQAPIKGK